MFLWIRKWWQFKNKYGYILSNQRTLFLKIKYFTLLLFLLITTSGLGKSWQLLWSDEFDYSGLPDTTRWVFDIKGKAIGVLDVATLQMLPNDGRELPDDLVAAGPRSLALSKEGRNWVKVPGWTGVEKSIVRQDHFGKDWMFRFNIIPVIPGLFQKPLF